jgi:hypothetical protein
MPPGRFAFPSSASCRGKVGVIVIMASTRVGRVPIAKSLSFPINPARGKEGAYLTLALGRGGSHRRLLRLLRLRLGA